MQRLAYPRASAAYQGLFISWSVTQGSGLSPVTLGYDLSPLQGFECGQRFIFPPGKGTITPQKQYFPLLQERVQARC